MFFIDLTVYLSLQVDIFPIQSSGDLSVVLGIDT